MESSEHRRGGQEQIIVLIDGASNYYELPRQLLERRRVPAEQLEDLKAKLQDVAGVFQHIAVSDIPGSTTNAEFEGARQLHYVGYYLRHAETEA